MKFFTTPNSKNIISMLRIVTTEKLNWVEIPSYIIFLCVNVAQLHLGNYPRKILLWTITPKQFLPGQLTTGEWSTLWNYLQDSCPRPFATPPDNCPQSSPPCWGTIEKCFELSRILSLNFILMKQVLQLSILVERALWNPN